MEYRLAGESLLSGGNLGRATGARVERVFEPPIICDAVGGCEECGSEWRVGDRQDEVPLRIGSLFKEGEWD